MEVVEIDAEEESEWKKDAVEKYEGDAPQRRDAKKEAAEEAAIWEALVGPARRRRLGFAWSLRREAEERDEGSARRVRSGARHSLGAP